MMMVGSFNEYIGNYISTFTVTSINVLVQVGMIKSRYLWYTMNVF